MCSADAVALVLYDSDYTWPGSLHDKKDTCEVKALAVSAQRKTQPVLWTSKRLPADCFALVAAPAGGALILSPSMIIYQNKARCRARMSDVRMNSMYVAKRSIVAQCKHVYEHILRCSGVLLQQSVSYAVMAWARRVRHASCNTTVASATGTALTVSCLRLSR